LGADQGRQEQSVEVRTIFNNHDLQVAIRGERMDFKQLKSSIEEIAKIASSVPEPFRDKCFEILLKSLAGGPSYRGCNLGAGPFGLEGSGFRAKCKHKSL
jgi:hypothetical protein